LKLASCLLIFASLACVLLKTSHCARSLCALFHFENKTVTAQNMKESKMENDGQFPHSSDEKLVAKNSPIDEESLLQILTL
jgi:hypothetical protein